MRIESIRQHLRRYSILGRRRTTINHAFASAIALNDEYDRQRVIDAIRALGLDPDKDLTCVYCDRKPAQTWDHVFGLVKGGQYAGFGHTVGNLLPCCRDCNSLKGNRELSSFLSGLIEDHERLNAKLEKLKSHFDHYLPPKLAFDEFRRICPDEMKQLQEAKNIILSEMSRADKIAEAIRKKVKEHLDGVVTQGGIA